MGSNGCLLTGLIEAESVGKQVHLAGLVKHSYSQNPVPCSGEKLACCVRDVFICSNTKAMGDFKTLWEINVFSQEISQKKQISVLFSSEIGNRYI